MTTVADAEETSPELTPGPDEWSVLMARVQAGDSAAYRRLLHSGTPYLRTICGHHHRDGRDVEDSVQDILLTIHMVRHTYDPARPFKPWAAAIAKRRIIDRLRVQRRTRARETFLDAGHETFPAPATNIEEAASESRALYLAVEALPERQREAIQLTKLKEMSLK